MTKRETTTSPVHLEFADVVLQLGGFARVSIFYVSFC